MKKKGLSLVELIVSLILMGILMPVVYVGFNFFLRNTIISQRRANAYMQVEYALENIRMHCISAISVPAASSFDGTRIDQRNDFSFRGEADIYNIQPDDLTGATKIDYTYMIENGNLVLKNNNTGQIMETLLDSDFDPTITFTHRQGQEPDFMEVTITAVIKQSRRAQLNENDIIINKSIGVPFWFTEVVD